MLNCIDDRNSSHDAGNRQFCRCYTVSIAVVVINDVFIAMEECGAPSPLFSGVQTPARTATFRAVIKSWKSLVTTLGPSYRSGTFIISEGLNVIFTFPYHEKGILQSQFMCDYFRDSVIYGGHACGDMDRNNKFATMNK